MVGEDIHMLGEVTFLRNTTVSFHQIAALVRLQKCWKKAWIVEQCDFVASKVVTLVDEDAVFREMQKIQPIFMALEGWHVPDDPELFFGPRRSFRHLALLIFLDVGIIFVEKIPKPIK